MRLPAAALAALIALGFAVDNVYAKDPALLSLGMEHFRDTATVKDDPAAATTSITTEEGFVQHTGLMRMVWTDEFLRAAIDKKTGQKSFKVEALITYGGNWRFYETAHYQTAGGPRAVPAIQISKEALNCAVGNCVYTERLEFPVDEELLRQLVAGYVPGKPALWRFSFTAKSGPDFNGELSNAEIAGFLARVDQDTGALPAVRENAARVSLKLELGVGGLPVAATGEQPSREGVLITAVGSGSVAQRSGIIIGDIVFALGDHPIKSLADLQAAVAACAKDSAVAVKLYRGTTLMSVTAQF